jgi:PAS domain S-box-containing protein
LMDAVPDVIAVKDMTGRYLISNAAHARWMGKMSSEEVVNRNEFEFFPPAVASRILAEDHAIIHSRKPVVNRLEKFASPTGEQSWMLSTKVPLQGLDGKIIGLVCIVRPVTAGESSESARALVEMAAGAALIRKDVKFLQSDDEAG